MIRHEISIATKLLTLLKKTVAIDIEDIHWADDHLLIMLKKLSTEVRNLPVFMILTSRPEGDPLDKIWKGSVFNTPFTTLDLPPLAKSETDRMAQSFSYIPEDYREKCFSMVQSNPFFLKLLLENYPNSFEEIPETLSQLVDYKLKTLGQSELKGDKTGCGTRP